jgi:hypothetical protein
VRIVRIHDRQQPEAAVVENALFGHPAVATIGVPNKRWAAQGL